MSSTVQPNPLPPTLPDALPVNRSQNNRFNGWLGYTKSGQQQVFRVSIDLITHGWQIIADGSAGRNRRAFYPHQIAISGFSIRLILWGNEEYVRFNNWMADYLGYLLDYDTASFARMTVCAAGKNFLRAGIPKTGIQWGDHVGSMVWRPMIAFDSAMDPLDTGDPTPSYVTPQANQVDINYRYFYPTADYIVNGNPAGAFDPILDGSKVPDNAQTPPTTAGATTAESVSGSAQTVLGVPKAIANPAILPGGVSNTFGTLPASSPPTPPPSSPKPSAPPASLAKPVNSVPPALGSLPGLGR